MATASFSFRAPVEFAEQTKALAQMFNMSSSDYVREAVREKNQRALKTRITFLSRQLATHHLEDNEAMDSATGDGLR